MPPNRSAFIRLLKIIAGTAVILIVIGYASWRSTEYLRGPMLTINTPEDWDVIQASTTVVSGRVERVHEISLNGSQLSVDEDGNFSDILIVFPGNNIITITASDQFGRSIEKKLHITGVSK